jgi:hypothetical protein
MPDSLAATIGAASRVLASPLDPLAVDATRSTRSVDAVDAVERSQVAGS